MSARLASILAVFMLLTTGQSLAGKPQSVTLDVPTMTCPLCPITVRKALEQVPGVKGARVDLDKKTATVIFDPDRTSTAALIKATTDAGYPSGLQVSDAPAVVLKSVLTCPNCGFAKAETMPTDSCQY